MTSNKEIDIILVDPYLSKNLPARGAIKELAIPKDNDKFITCDFSYQKDELTKDEDLLPLALNLIDHSWCLPSFVLPTAPLL